MDRVPFHRPDLINEKWVSFNNCHGRLEVEGHHRFFARRIRDNEFTLMTGDGRYLSIPGHGDACLQGAPNKNEKILMGGGSVQYSVTLSRDDFESSRFNYVKFDNRRQAKTTWQAFEWESFEIIVEGGHGEGLAAHEFTLGEILRRQSYAERCAHERGRCPTCSRRDDDRRRWEAYSRNGNFAFGMCIPPSYSKCVNHDPE